MLASIIADAIGPVFDGLNKLFPNEVDRLKAQATLEQLQQQPELWQALIDQQEAASTDLYNSRWRPTVAWICCAAFAWTYVTQPILVFFFSLIGIHPVLPSLDMSQMMPILLGMLGLGTMRTIERVNDKIPKGKG